MNQTFLAKHFKNSKSILLGVMSFAMLFLVAVFIKKVKNYKTKTYQQPLMVLINHWVCAKYIARYNVSFQGQASPSLFFV